MLLSDILVSIYINTVLISIDVYTGVVSIYIMFAFYLIITGIYMRNPAALEIAASLNLKHTRTRNPC